jgi:ubiquinone/menaquinone biosynthesis C-methylase UbiE
MPDSRPPICNYEGSDYQASFWERGGREYEDQAEAVALGRLLPPTGELMLELGAGAGRNTPRYAGFRRVVLLDYSRSQLEQAQKRLGSSPQYIFVAADVYRLPFVQGVFDAATMIRVLHHMAEPLRALAQVRDALRPGAVFILEFANKRNIKSVLRYWMGRQEWNPFSPEPVEFARLNYDFHPRQVQAWCEQLGFRVARKLTVSHFRSQALKRWVPVGLLTAMDALLQPTGNLWQWTPSVFFELRAGRTQRVDLPEDAAELQLFRCPECGNTPLSPDSRGLVCGQCGRIWGLGGGIYDFRDPLNATQF